MTRVVAIGGGHGLANTLKAVRRYASEVTAVVSVADDGGSSGRLRNAFGIPAPGDLRRCLVALGDPDSRWAQVFEHRFDAAELAGHPVGNLVIAGLARVTGDFQTALDEAGRLVGTTGRVLPATSAPVVLKAEAESGSVEGQVRVAEAGRIAVVSLVPPDPEAPAAVVEALAAADQIVLGPGSLFTSVLAAAVVPAVRDGIRAAAGRATRVYVCNLHPQEPETAGYDAAAHVEALMAHGIEVDVMLHDPAEMKRGDPPLRCISAALAAGDGQGHDPARLASALEALAPGPEAGSPDSRA